MDDLELAGASPETLIAVHDRQVMTYPLAGTRPRGKTNKKTNNSNMNSNTIKKKKPNTTCSST